MSQEGVPLLLCDVRGDGGRNNCGSLDPSIVLVECPGGLSCRASTDVVQHPVHDASRSWGQGPRRLLCPRVFLRRCLGGGWRLIRRQCLGGGGRDHTTAILYIAVGKHLLNQQRTQTTIPQTPRHTHTHTHTHAHTLTNNRVCVIVTRHTHTHRAHTYTHMFLYAHECARIYLYVYIHMCDVCMCIHTYVYKRIYIYIYISIYI